MSRLDGTRIYVDANAIIYFAEAHPIFGPPVRSLVEYSETGKCTLVTSELSLAEALVLPFARNNAQLIERYNDIIQARDNLQIVPVDRRVLVESASLRAALGGKLPDAIHVASALIAGCTMIVTEDGRMKSPVRLQLVSTGELHQLLPTPPTP